MLSHVWYAKDIKTALLAADIIINKWGFKDYKLEIYGALDKTPAYTTSCQEIIATKNLRKHVNLMGEADPIMVLERTVSHTQTIFNRKTDILAVGLPQLVNI
jgi:hypothetical protein